MKINPPWLLDADVLKLRDVFPEALFVGGCIRNTLMKRPVSDLDLASPLTPDEICRRVKKHKGIKVIPTGIEHGTLTLVVGKRSFEITTFRRDLETDGRHAKVGFSKKMEDDASRRDFTINALYMDYDGNVLDPVGGLGDIQESRVRFIGNADQRIREDYLRILRFFRFHAYYAGGDLDPDGLRASINAKSHLNKLSGERIRDEIFKILLAPDPVTVWGVMMKAQILSDILPEDTGSKTLKVLIKQEEKNKIPADPIRRFAAVLGSYSPTLKARLKLSNKDSKRLEEMLDPQVHALMQSHPDHLMIYGLGEDLYRDIALLQKKSLKSLANWVKPDFPLNGQDALALNLKGPQVGIALDAAEMWWVKEKFKPDREACLLKLSQLAQSLT